MTYVVMTNIVIAYVVMVMSLFETAHSEALFRYPYHIAMCIGVHVGMPGDVCVDICVEMCVDTHRLGGLCCD